MEKKNMNLSSILKVALNLSDAVFTVSTATTAAHVLNDKPEAARKSAEVAKKVAITSVSLGIAKTIVDVVTARKASEVVVEEVVEEEVNEAVEEDE